MKIIHNKSVTILRTTLIISGIIGIALSYSSVYLFHIVLFISILYILYQQWKDKYYTKTIFTHYPLPILVFFAFTFLWFIFLLFFAQNKTYAFYHLIYIGIGTLIMIIIPAFTRDKNDIKNVMKALGLITCVDLLIGFGESLGLFRWFISRLSNTVQYFGYNNELQTILSESKSLKYVYTMPTGFHYNPNDFAVFASMTLPFFLLAKNKYVSIITSVLIIFLTVAAGAKIVFIADIIIIILSFFYNFSKINILKCSIPLIFIFFIVTNGFGILNGRSIKINEIQSFCYKTVGLTPPTYNMQIDELENSNSTRQALILFGIHYSLKNYLWGSGGGQSRYQLEKVGGISKNKICNLHSFWIELLFEGGIIYLLAFIFMYVYMFIHLIKIFFSNRNTFMGYLSAATIISLAGFIISSNTPSSVVYFLPMYFLFALSVSLIKIYTHESTFAL